MTTFVDTNVLIDVLEVDSVHHQWSRTALEAAKKNGPVFVSDAVYSELSVTFDTAEATDSVINQLALVRCGYSNQVLFDAGKAYARYRSNQGQKLNVLPDFFIGALAASEEAPVVTRDPGKIRTYFPDVQIVSP